MEHDIETGITISTMAELGAVLRDVRKSSNLTQSTIAGMANWGNRFISEVESGKPTVRAQMVFDLANWLGLEIVIRKKGGPR